MRTPTHILARLALWPLSLPYRGALRLRDAAYKRGWARVETTPVPVVSIGNLSVGGTGKTPLVEMLCRKLDAMGMRTAVVSRGYGRKGGAGVTLVSRGDGEGPLVDVRTAGDEPYLLAMHLPRTAVLVAADRVAAARAAVEQANAQVIIADDAYQHRRLARDLDLLAVDATNPTEAGWLLPAGGLREPLEAAGRASAFLITRSDRISDTTQLRSMYRAHNATAPFFHTATRPCGVLLPDGSRIGVEGLRDERAVAFCGIAKPRFFQMDLQRLGVNLAEFHIFGDHHWYEERDVERIEAAARTAGTELILTTEKDWVRLSEAQRRRLPLHRLLIEAEAWEDRALEGFLQQHLTKEAAA